MSVKGVIRIVPKEREEGIENYGTIRYVDLPRGHIKIVNDFFQSYMVKVDVPHIGKRWMHKALEGPLLRALGVINHKARYDSVYEYIEVMQFFNPRHMWYRKEKPLSMHAYGLAVDINPWENMPGTIGAIPEDIILVFERMGLTWGGRWSRSDPMHLQLSIG